MLLNWFLLWRQLFAILDYWWVEGLIEWWQKQTFTSFSELANMYHVKESSSGGEDLDEDSEYAGLLDCGDSSTSATSSAAGLLASPSSSTCTGVLTGGLGVGCTAAPTDKIISISSCVIRPTNPHLSSDERLMATALGVAGVEGYGLPPDARDNTLSSPVVSSHSNICSSSITPVSSSKWQPIPSIHMLLTSER